MMRRTGWMGAILLAVCGIAAMPRASRAIETHDYCYECHKDLEDTRLAAPTRKIAQDIHIARGLGCAGCHGGDPSDPEMSGMSADKGFRGAPTRGQIAELCASCHADAAFMKRYNPKPYIFSVAEFRESVHCKRIALGDQKVATCTNCHGVHGILPHTDPASPVYPTNVPATCAKCHNATYMKGRNIPTNQYALYVKSVHGRALLEKHDLSAPACNDCHGNHGAVPPNSRDISLVCGSCHGREGELFLKSPVAKEMQKGGKRGCVTCHSNHDVQIPTDAMISEGPGGACGECHTPGSKGDVATRAMITGFHALRGKMAHADSVLAQAEKLGMDSEAGRVSLKQAKDHVLKLRVALHSFDRKQIAGVLGNGLEQATAAENEGLGAMRDWRVRRVGLAVSLGVIVALMALLVLKIRSMGPPS